MWVAQAGAGSWGQKRPSRFFLLVLPSLGHAIAFFLGFPKDILEVRFREVELDQGRGYRGRV